MLIGPHKYTLAPVTCASMTHLSKMAELESRNIRPTHQHSGLNNTGPSATATQSDATAKTGVSGMTLTEKPRIRRKDEALLRPCL